MRLRHPSVLTVFVLSAFAWMVVLTLLWTKASPWTSYPVAALSHFALEQGVPMWVRTVHKSPGAVEVETTIEMPVPDAGGRLGEISIEVDPGRYAYGLPIFLALLLAARGPKRLAMALGGYVLLLPAQVFSLSFYVLMQMVLYAQGSTRVLRVSQWQVEAIVYGYQVGSLVLPTLVPIVLWLWLDRQFFNDVVLRGWRGHATQSAPAPAAAAAAAAAAATHVPTSLSPAKVVASSAPPASAPPTAAPPALPSVRRPAEISSSSAAVLPPRR